MKEWNVGYNNYYLKAYLFLEEIPSFYYHLDNIVTWLCNRIHWRFHQYIHMPIFNWCSSKRVLIKKIDIPYFTARELFPDVFKDCDDFSSLKDKIFDVNTFYDRRKMALDLHNNFYEILKKTKEYNNGK
jgi:hypothetical protein